MINTPRGIASVTALIVLTIASGSAQEPGRIPPDVSLTRSSSWKQLVVNVIDDQKHVARFPVRLFLHDENWKPTLAVGAATAALIALDPHDTPYFGRTNTFHEFNKVASGVNTALFMAAVPVAFYGWSAHEQDSYGKQTVFLAAQSVADAQIVSFAIKMATFRLRPIDVAPRGNYADTWFDADFLGGKSFPSGHTMAAFALADVFSERYSSHRWVPWVSYGLAGTVAFSRLPTQAHFPSDIFVGAVLSTVITHYLVLHHAKH